jgi:hypothetical protein
MVTSVCFSALDRIRQRVPTVLKSKEQTRSLNF